LDKTVCAGKRDFRVEQNQWAAQKSSLLEERGGRGRKRGEHSRRKRVRANAGGLKRRKSIPHNRLVGRTIWGRSRTAGEVEYPNHSKHQILSGLASGKWGGPWGGGGGGGGGKQPAQRDRHTGTLLKEATRKGRKAV